MFGFAPQLLAQQQKTPVQEESLEDYFKLLQESLLDIDITLVSKRQEKLFEAPAAVYVIAAEDIRRSGHRSVPELPRMVPGLQVAQVNANEWI